MNDSVNEYLITVSRERFMKCVHSSSTRGRVVIQVKFELQDGVTTRVKHNLIIRPLTHGVQDSDSSVLHSQCNIIIFYIP